MTNPRVPIVVVILTLLSTLATADDGTEMTAEQKQAIKSLTSLGGRVAPDRSE